jgi:hypothetical protein
MKNSLTLVCALSLLIFVALACSAPDKSASNVVPTPSSGQNSAGTKTAASTPEAPAAIKVTATDLMQAYVDNKVKADDTYKDKTVEVSGVISEVGKDIMNNPYVALKTKEMIYTVQVYFTDEENKKLGELKKGQAIKVTGRCDGALGNVTVKDAALK